MYIDNHRVSHMSTYLGCFTKARDCKLQKGFGIMCINYFSVACFILTFSVTNTETATYSEVMDLFSTLMSNYSKDIRPTSNQDTATEVLLSLSIVSVIKLDEVDGILTTGISMVSYWKDVNMQWEPSDYGNITSLPIRKELLWTPDFVVFNPAEHTKSLGKDYEVTYVHANSSGHMKYPLVDVLNTACDVDVTYFPFDVQRCLLALMPLGLTHTYLNLTLKPIDMSRYYENNAWILKSTSVESLMYAKVQPYARFWLVLERRYAFYVLNMFFPVLFLAFLNTMVFILPADSGERVGYAITCLLSLSVYMTFTSEGLPNSSNPLPIIIFVLLSYIMISALICLATIVGLRLHLHNNNNASTPPKVLLKLLYFSHKKYDLKTEIAEPVESEAGNKMASQVHVQGHEFIWKDIATKFDRMCLITSNVCLLLLTLLYFALVFMSK